MQAVSRRNPLTIVIAGSSVPDDGPRRLRFIRRAAGAALIAATLSGCTGARVSDVASAGATGATPAEILVDVSAAPMSDGAQAEAARQVGAQLQSELVQRLTQARVTAEPFVLGTSHPGAAVLRVSILQTDPGNALERIVIGLGFGKATLQVKADLESGDTARAQDLTTFRTASDSGVKPGILVPGGAALATGSIVHLAIAGGIDLAANSRGGFSRPLAGTATAIVNQLKKYYESAGWYWPAEA